MSSEQKSEAEQRQFWQMAVETWRASGLGVRAFCRQEGLSEPSFYAWRRRLTTTVPAEEGKRSSEPQPFIEVPLPAAQPAGLELVLASGHVLRIGSGVDSNVLMNVLTAIRQARLC